MKKSNSDQEKMSEKNTVVKNLTDASEKLSEEDPELLVEKLKELVIQYTKNMDTEENISFGVLTKYHISLGVLHNFQKVLVKERFGKNRIK